MGAVYGGPMIPRYSPPELVALWSADRRYAIWLEVELAACDAMEDAKLVPRGTAAKIRKQKLVLDANGSSTGASRLAADVENVSARRYL